MAIKTFTTGEVLTAADTNTYLANSGLVYVAGATFTGAGTFDVTGFSSSYLFYHLEISVISELSGTGISGVAYSGATARANYYGSTFFSSYLGTSGVQNTAGNIASFYLGDAASGNNAAFYTCMVRGVGTYDFGITVQGFDTVNTRSLTGSYTSYASNSSFDKIRFTSGSGNLGGSWALMGVRKP
jgi:hypothetical protein